MIDTSLLAKSPPVSKAVIKLSARFFRLTLPLIEKPAFSFSSWIFLQAAEFNIQSCFLGDPFDG